MESNILQSTRALALNSGCKIEFVLDNTQNPPQIIPVLLLNGITSFGDNPYVWLPEAEGKVAVISTEYDDTTHQVNVVATGPDGGDPITINPYLGVDNGDWLIISEEQLNNKSYEIIYPRVFINSLALSTDSRSLVVKYKKENKSLANSSTELSLLQPYTDYSILTRSLLQQYALTINNDIIFKNNIITEFLDNNASVLFTDQSVQVNYSLSTADTDIYLDAIEVLKENAYPKVSYTVKVNYLNNDYVENIYNTLGYVGHINDADLKFNNVRGYVSSITLDLDSPENDMLEIKNYKNKFEDLFSMITAETQEMKKNNYTLELASAAFTANGEISQNVLQSSIKKVNLDYAFNNGQLTIDEDNGIWGTSDNGVVAFRGGGIFTATEKNIQGNWKWNTGITPEGINADLITSGQLDTNLIKIYAGDQLRFQMNGDGIFAYKTKISDASDQDSEHPYITHGKVDENSILLPGQDLDYKQYVTFNENGLSLIAKQGALVLNTEGTDYYEVLNEDDINKNSNLIGVNEIKRVEVSWRGLILRNWQNEQVFFADPETGNLTLKGTIKATDGYIGSWILNSHRLYCESKTIVEQNGIKRYNSYVALNAGGEEAEEIAINSTTTQLADTSLYAFWAGDRNPDKAHFSIKKNGMINATAGQIGGWTIGATQLESTYIRLFANSTETSMTTNNNYAVNTENSALIIYNNANKTAANGVIYMTTDGTIFAKDYYIYIPSGNNNGYYRSLLEILQTGTL